MALLQKEHTPNLTELEWTPPLRSRLKSRTLNLDSLLGSIPATVTSLSVSSCIFASATLDSVPSTPKCPNIKTMKIRCRLDTNQPHLVLLAHQKIMSSMSGVEHLDMVISLDEFDGVPPEDLVFFSRRLRSLRAKLSPDCFNLSLNRSYDTLNCLPNLTRLELEPVMADLPADYFFSFASIPPTVTSLGIGNLPIRSTELSNLPHAKIKPLYTTRTNAENGEQVIMQLLTPPDSNLAACPLLRRRAKSCEC